LTVDDLLAVHLSGLKDPDATVCAMAVQDLSTLASYSDKVVPALTTMLSNDKKEYVRRVAAACLACLGAQAKSALPALKAGLDDPDANLRTAFQTAIDQLETSRTAPTPDDEIKKNLLILKDINEFKKAAREK
jgi:HEAT repeat protein